MSPVDEGWLQDILVRLLRTSTQVPFGETEIAPGDPRIVAAIDEVVLPWIQELHPEDVRRHPQGDVAARFGPDADGGLLIQTYVVSQHANLMDDRRAGEVVDGSEVGLDGPALLGQGASQNKGPMAAALAGVRARSRELARPVWLAINTEGRSSHGGSRRVIDDLEVKAAQGLVVFGTDLRVSLGNRGRVDVHIDVEGASCHSSQPWLGTNPIGPAAQAIVHLGSLELPEADPTLGPSTATPYQFSCFPVAPHTIPERALVIVDRRLLPGEDPDRAVQAIRDHLSAAGMEDVSVTAGVHMLPAKVGENEPIVRALVDGVREAAGAPAETFYSLNAFDAGYACSKGIPAPMFGPGKRRFAGEGLTGTDAVTLRDCSTAASAIAFAIDRLCGVA
jgi:succinyl-diaminopimelate desuccinylase